MSTMEQAIPDLTGRVVTLEQLVGRASEDVRELAAASQERDRHIDEQIRAMRDHVDVGLAALGDKLSRTRESNPRLWLSVGSLALAGIVASAAIITLAISNATGPIAQRQTGEELRSKETAKDLDAHEITAGHPPALAQHAETIRRVTLVEDDVRDIRNAGGGRFTKSDYERHADRQLRQAIATESRLAAGEVEQARAAEWRRLWELGLLERPEPEIIR